LKEKAMQLEKKEQKIVTVSRVAVIANALLSVLKITVGLLAGSMAVIADGIDSASDVLASLITLFTAHIIGRPPDKKYPYGYRKADTMATKILSFIIFFAGAQLAISSIGRFIHPEPRAIPASIAIYVIIISIITKQLLALYLKKAGKKEKSSMLLANAKNMQSDVVISLSVLTGLIFTYILKMPVFDVITAFLVSLWIMGVAVKIFFDSNLDLMDGVDNIALYDKVVEACKMEEGVSHPHRIRIRKIEHLYLISLDIELPGALSLDEGHLISQRVEKNIKKLIPNVYDILIHIEPQGNTEEEVFGISETDL
jgi:cation diffusion facilitator family transporter